MEKEEMEKLLKESEERLKEFDKKGLDLFLNSEYRNIFQARIRRMLEEDVAYFEKKLKEIKNEARN